MLHSSGNWKDSEGTFSQDMFTILAYLQIWRLKLSHTKTVTAAFHLNSREAKRELKVYNNGGLLPFCPTPTYLGVKLDRSLTFCHRLVALRKKLSSRVTLLRRLVGLGWGAGAKTQRIATLSLVYSTAEYYAPVWCRSAHTRLIGSVLNNAFAWSLDACVPLQRTIYLYSQPAELCSMGATLSLAHCGSLDPDHTLYGLLSGSSDTRQVKQDADARLCQLRGIFWTTLPDLAPALLNGQISNGKRSTVKMLPGSMLLCLGPVPGLLG